MKGTKWCCAVLLLAAALSEARAQPSCPPKQRRATPTGPCVAVAAPTNPGQGPAVSQAVNLPLTALQVNPNTVVGGNHVQGTVELAQAPGPNGVTVTLESSNPQLAGVPPSITITHGTTSAETGPTVKATFPIHTQPVQEATTVMITARAGVQTLQANLGLRRPTIRGASLSSANIVCDGNHKVTVTYSLTGPAPSGLKVRAETFMTAPNLTASARYYASETVPTGNSSGTMRIEIGFCHPEWSGGCWVRGSVRVEGDGSYQSFGRPCP